MTTRKQFGTVPFSLNTYGPTLVSGDRAGSSLAQSDSAVSDELAQLQSFLDDFKLGNVSQKSRLAPFLRSASRDVRLYATQLFCDVANHDDVQYLFEATESLVQDVGELRMKLVSLAYTLSPRSVECLLRIREGFEGLELDQHFLDALSIIIGDEAADSAETMNGIDLSVLESAITTLQPGVYYCQGEQVFIPDLCTQLLEAAAQAEDDGSSFPYSLHPRVLSNFTGVPCPVDYGMMVNVELYSRIEDYTQEIKSRRWRRGVKYFYGHIMK